MSTLDSLRSTLSSPRALLAAYERYGAWLPKVAALVLTIFIARIAAQLAWAIVPLPKADWQPPPAASAPAASTVDLNAIASANLFGQYQAPHLDAASMKNTKETNLNLSLLGVFAWNQVKSRALIQAEGQEAKPFAIGDAVISGVTLQAVLPDRVILSRGGRLEALRLNKESSSTDVAAADSGDADQPADDSDDNSDNDQASALGDVRNELLADPSKAAQFIRVMPLNAGSGLNGYRIYPGPDRTLFTNTGLRPGDVVTAVNGVQLNDPARALQLLADMAHSNDLNIVVNRGGTSQTIQVNLNQ